MKKYLSIILIALFCGCSFVGCGHSKERVEKIQHHLTMGVWKKSFDWENDGRIDGVFTYTFYDNGMFTFEDDFTDGTLETITYGKYKIEQDQIKLFDQIYFIAGGGSANSAVEPEEKRLSYSYQDSASALTLSDGGGTYTHII